MKSPPSSGRRIATALDGKVLQSQTQGGWDEARARSRHSAFWFPSTAAVGSAGSSPTPQPMTGRGCAKGSLTNRTRRVGVWADTAYRSAANERFLEKNCLRSFIHRKKPKGRPMSAATAKANALKSKV